MSRRATDPSETNWASSSGASSTGEAPEGSPSLESPLGGNSGGAPARKRAFPRWVGALPFFTSALLFLSGFFSVFAPLPLLLLRMQKGRAWLWSAALSNSVLVGALSGTLSLAFYLIFVLGIALSLPELLTREARQPKGRVLEKAAAITLLIMVAIGIALAVVQWQTQGTHPIATFKAEISQILGQLNPPAESGRPTVDELDLEEAKENVFRAMPSALAIFSLVMVWLNLSLLIRLNPNSLREKLGLDASYFRRWKTPEYLVWPTILAGGIMLLEGSWIFQGWVTDGANNVFRFLMALYALQGLSILSFLFDVWNVRGFLRSLGYIASIFLMLPLLLSLGFFDLWFDFRSKLRQS